MRHFWRFCKRDMAGPARQRSAGGDTQRGQPRELRLGRRSNYPSPPRGKRQGDCPLPAGSRLSPARPHRHVVVKPLRFAPSGDDDSPTRRLVSTIFGETSRRARSVHQRPWRPRARTARGGQRSRQRATREVGRALTPSTDWAWRARIEMRAPTGRQRRQGPQAASEAHTAEPLATRRRRLTPSLSAVSSGSKRTSINASAP